ncbi:hypothetical protein D3C71_2037820 [compost metagenome]
MTSATFSPRFLNTSTIFFSLSATSDDAFSDACWATSEKIFLSSSDRLFHSLPEMTVFKWSTMWPVRTMFFCTS